MLIEHLLNLCWLLLFVPAFWVWRQQTRCVPNAHYRSLQCLVALICAVFLLFPVISASDDLHAMRPEMEESSSSKRALKQVSNQRACAQCHHAPPAAQLTPFLLVLSPDKSSDRNFHKQELPPASAGLTVISSRAPPARSSFSA